MRRVRPSQPDLFKTVPAYELPSSQRTIAVELLKVLLAEVMMSVARVGRAEKRRHGRSGARHVTAHRIAQPPKVTFVMRLQPSPLPSRTARQLPDLSTTIRVRSSLTDGSRPRGALPLTEVRARG